MIALAPIPRSSFPAMSSALARDIAATSGKLERLTRLAKKTGVFDSAAQELDELTQVVKADIQQLKGRIDQLAPLHMRRNKQAEQYSEGVMRALQLQLAGTTARFQEILTERTAAMQQQQETRKLFTGQLSNGTATMMMPKHLAADELLEESCNENAPLLLVVSLQEEDQEIEQRAISAQHISRMIGELHEIIQNLNAMVQQHHDLIMRIDANVDEVVTDVEDTESELRKYWRMVRSNQWLLMKIVAILVVFVILFLFFFSLV